MHRELRSQLRLVIDSPIAMPRPHRLRALLVAGTGAGSPSRVPVTIPPLCGLEPALPLPRHTKAGDFDGSGTGGSIARRQPRPCHAVAMHMATIHTGT